jgi:hypothetical protein
MKGPPKSSVFKQVLRRRKFLGLLPSATAATLTFGGVGRAAGEGVKSDTEFSRDDAAKIIGNARKIVRPGGIERLEAIDIGGIKQWVSYSHIRTHESRCTRDDLLGDERVWQEEDFPCWTFVGKLFRDPDSPASSGVSACICWRQPVDKWA